MTKGKNPSDGKDVAHSSLHIKFMRRLLLVLSLLVLPCLSQAQWEQLAGPYGVAAKDVALRGDTLFVIGANEVFRSSDHGSTWIVPTDSCDLKDSIKTYTSKFYRFGDKVYIGGRSLWLWTGSRWATICDALVTSMTSEGSTVFFSTYEMFGSYIRKLSSDGMSWSNLPLPELPGESYIPCIGDAGSQLFAIRFAPDYLESQFYSSPDQGVSWHDGDWPSFQEPHVLVSEFGNLYLSDGGRLLSSRDTGKSWRQIPGIGSTLFLKLADSRLITGSQNSQGVTSLYCVASNDSVSMLVSGDTLSGFVGFATDANFAYVATASRGIWRAPLASLPLSVPSAKSVESSSLDIYPNPLSTKSLVAFALPSRAIVSLRLYHELGILRSAIFEGEMEAGPHEIPFAGEGLVDGMYSVVLSGDGNRQVGRVLIVR